MPGVDPGTVVVIGGGVVGINAAKMACGLGAKVYILDMNLERLRYLSDVMPSNCFLLMSKPTTVRRLIKEADVVVGAVLIPGAKAPKLLTRQMLKTMKKGAVLVRKVLESAIANAENNHGLDVDELIVAEAWVGKNLVMKRGRPRARGRFGRIHKPFAEITIKVRQVEETA